MQKEFASRQNMHLTVLNLIDNPEFEAAWKDQNPTAFTTALASEAAELADYDLTDADATLLAKELADFEKITADPSAAISRRRALTVTLRPKFREVAVLLKKMDRHFRRLLAGGSLENLAPQLHRLVKRLSREGIALDYAQLKKQLNFWTTGHAESVKTSWAKEFWQAPNLETPAA